MLIRDKLLKKYKENCFSYCSKSGTMKCPNSYFCLAKDDKPYFELDKEKVWPWNYILINKKL